MKISSILTVIFLSLALSACSSSEYKMADSGNGISREVAATKNSFDDAPCPVFPPGPPPVATRLVSNGIRSAYGWTSSEAVSALTKVIEKSSEGELLLDSGAAVKKPLSLSSVSVIQDAYTYKDSAVYAERCKYYKAIVTVNGL